jgi:hypothetical protein
MARPRDQIHIKSYQVILIYRVHPLNLHMGMGCEKNIRDRYDVYNNDGVPILDTRSYRAFGLSTQKHNLIALE